MPIWYETQLFLAAKYHETLPNKHINYVYIHLILISFCQDLKNVKIFMASSTNSVQKLIEIFPCFDFKLQSNTMVATRKFTMKSNSRCYLIFYVCFPMLQHERVKKIDFYCSNFRHHTSIFMLDAPIEQYNVD